MSAFNKLAQLFSGQARASSQRRALRHARREQLHTVVRESMISAGILSASYKFKVLALDPQADQLMVLMELAPEFGGQLGSLVEIEQAIARGAKDSYNLSVAAVYWRNNRKISTSAASKPQPRPQATEVIDVGVLKPAKAPPSGPAPLMGPSQYGDVT